MLKTSSMRQELESLLYKILLIIVLFIVYKYTCQVKIILILISLITKGVELQRRNKLLCTYKTGIIRIDYIIIIIYINYNRIFLLWINRLS